MHQRSRQPRLKAVAVRPGGPSHARSLHHLQLDQAFTQQPQRPPLAPLGWGAARQRDQAGLLLPIELAAVLALGGSSSRPKTTRVRPMAVVTDTAATCPVVLDELLPGAWHRTDQDANNHIEADHGRLKARLRSMRALKRPGAGPQRRDHHRRAWLGAEPSPGPRRTGGRGASQPADGCRVRGCWPWRSEPRPQSRRRPAVGRPDATPPALPAPTRPAGRRWPSAAASTWPGRYQPPIGLAVGSPRHFDRFGGPYWLVGRGLGGGTVTVIAARGADRHDKSRSPCATARRAAAMPLTSRARRQV